jgi:hypothetical protein
MTQLLKLKARDVLFITGFLLNDCGSKLGKPKLHD